MMMRFVFNKRQIFLQRTGVIFLLRQQRCFVFTSALARRSPG